MLGRVSLCAGSAARTRAAGGGVVGRQQGQQAHGFGSHGRSVARQRVGWGASTSSASPSPSRGGLCTVCSTERDPFLGNGGPVPQQEKQVAIFWPKCFREAATSVNSLQQNNVVVVNISGIPNLEDQQRAVDFIAGACYALEGQQDVLAESIFIFFPNNGGHPEQEEPALKHSQAARDALISLARSEIGV